MIKKNAIKGSCVRMDMNVVMDARKQSRKEDAGRNGGGGETYMQ